MDNKRIDKILEGLKNIEISQAVLYEKLTQMDHRLDRTNKRLDHANEEFEEIKKRVDRHDKIVGGMAFAFAVVTTLIKMKII